MEFSESRGPRPNLTTRRYNCTGLKTLPGRHAGRQCTSGLGSRRDGAQRAAPLQGECFPLRLLHLRMVPGVCRFLVDRIGLVALLSLVVRRR